MAVITTREQARAGRLETLVKDINILERRPDSGLHSLHLDFRGDNERGVNMWDIEEVVTLTGAVAPGSGVWQRRNGPQMVRYLEERKGASYKKFWDILEGRVAGSIYHCAVCRDWWAKESERNDQLRAIRAVTIPFNIRSYDENGITYYYNPAIVQACKEGGHPTPEML